MNKITEGRNKALVSMERLDMEVNGHTHVSYEQPFFLDVLFYFEEAIKPLEDDPGAREFIELISVRVQSPLYLSNNMGMTMSFDGRCELVNVLTDKQLDSVIVRLKKQSAGHVFYAEPIRSTAKLYTFDTARLHDDEDEKRKLGFDLMENYKR
jgi:hypothetical protein